MILASGEGQLVFLVVMAVFGLINWLANKANSGDKKTPAAPGQSGADPASPRRPSADSEEERMRRFLEALGLPADSKPAPEPGAEPRRVPPIVFQPTVPRRPHRPLAPPPPLPSARRPRSLDELPAPGLRVEQIALPELATSAVPEFETLSSKVSALPTDFPATHDEAARPAGPTLGETLQAALASPRQLRSAFILSEIFGTPPGLRQP